MAHARKIITHDIQLNLSLEEAQLIRALVGKLSSLDDKGGIFDALGSVDVASADIKLTSGHDRVPVYCLHIEKK